MTSELLPKTCIAFALERNYKLKDVLSDTVVVASFPGILVWSTLPIKMPGNEVTVAFIFVFYFGFLMFFFITMFIDNNNKMQSYASVLYLSNQS